MTATARIISTTPGGYADEVEFTIAQHAKGVWIGERVVRVSLGGLPMTAINFKPTGLDALSADEFEAAALALDVAQNTPA